MAKEKDLTTVSAINDNAFVRMVDENGNSVKIQKASFMNAIKAALPNLLEDQSTDGTDFLSLVNRGLGKTSKNSLADSLWKTGKGTKKLQYNRAAENKYYARVGFASVSSTSSSLCVLAVNYPMNSASIRIGVVNAIKYNSVNITYIVKKGIVDGHDIKVFYDYTYFYLEIPSWNTMSVEVIAQDCTSIVLDSVTTLPSNVNELTE